MTLKQSHLCFYNHKESVLLDHVLMKQPGLYPDKRNCISTPNSHQTTHTQTHTTHTHFSKDSSPCQPGLQTGLTSMRTGTLCEALFWPQSHAVTWISYCCCRSQISFSVFLMLPWVGKNEHLIPDSSEFSSSCFQMRNVFHWYISPNSIIKHSYSHLQILVAFPNNF